MNNLTVRSTGVNQSLPSGWSALVLEFVRTTLRNTGCIFVTSSKHRCLLFTRRIAFPFLRTTVFLSRPNSFHSFVSFFLVSLGNSKDLFRVSRAIEKCYLDVAPLRFIEQTIHRYLIIF